jgi:hypothetical protein
MPTGPAPAGGGRLEDLFEVSGGGPVWVGRDLVHQSVDLGPVPARLELFVGFLVEQLPPGVQEQAVGVQVDGGYARYRGESYDTVFVWSAGQTEPERIEVAGAGGPPRVLVWNVWRDGAGEVQAMTGDAGMLVERADRELLLRCATGTGGPGFADLVAALRWEPR